MKYLVLSSILFLSHLGSLSAEEIPMLVLQQENKTNPPIIEKINISEKSYSSFLNKSLRKALRKRQFKRHSNDFDLDYIVIGMSTDVRVGIFSWNLSSSAAVEYHLKVVPNE